MNTQGTDGHSLTVVLPELRSHLNGLRLAHGAKSAVGHHASNIAELLKLPNPPARLLKVQMDGLQNALRDPQ